MGKYSVSMKVTSATLNKKKKSVLVRGILGDKEWTTSKVDVVDHEAVWTEDNVILKGTLHWKLSEELHITLSTSEGHKLKTIASFIVDLIPFVNETSPGGHREFSFKKSLSLKKGKTVVITLFLSIKREVLYGGDHTEKETPSKATESRKSRTMNQALKINEKVEQEETPSKATESRKSRTLYQSLKTNSDKIDQDTTKKYQTNPHAMNQVRSTLAKGKVKIIDDHTSPRSKKPMNTISPRKSEEELEEAPLLKTPQDSPTKVLANQSRGRALFNVDSDANDEDDFKTPTVRPLRSRTPRPGSELPKKKGDLTPTKSNLNSEEGSENSTETPKNHVSSPRNHDLRTSGDKSPERSPPDKKISASVQRRTKLPTISPRLMEGSDIRSKNGSGSPGGVQRDGNFVYSIDEERKPARLIEGDRNSLFHKKRDQKASTLGFAQSSDPSPLTSQNQLYHTLENKVKKHTRPNSDITGSKNNINVAQLKQEYLASKYGAAEKYLVEDIIMEQTPRELHVVAAIIWKSLVQWESFVLNYNIYQRILAACERAVEKFAKSRTMLSNWLSTFLSLLYIAEEEKKKVHFANQTDVESRIQDFIDRLKALASTTFENVFKLLNERLDQVTKTVINEFLSPSTLNIVQDDQSSLSQYFVNLSDWLNVLNEHCIFDEVKNQFFCRVVDYLVTSVMAFLFLQASSYTMGIQVKMLVNKIEEWVRGKVGIELVPLANTQMEPLREAANVLCLLQKSELTKSDFRQAVCALLWPAHIALILEGYLPDQYDKEPVPKWLINEIKEANSSYTPLPNTLDPNHSKQLDFSFVMTPLDINNIILPKVILEKPCFSFLKPSADSSLTTTSW